MRKEKDNINTTGIQYLLDLNQRHSEEFLRQEDERRNHRKRYSTEIAALKCMDGRVHLPVMTNIPLGVIQPYRNLGGRFYLGWSFFQRHILNWRKYAGGVGRDCVVLVTYHYSKGDEHRGCKGHDYDKGRAMEYALELKRQFDEDFQPGVPLGDHASVFYSFVVGIETDDDALIWHSQNGNEVLDLSQVAPGSESELLERLYTLHPEIAVKTPTVLDHMLPLVKGNIEHIAEVKASNRTPLEMDHQESILGLGQGFGWLHLPKIALIVGPWEPNLSEPIRTAASLIEKNLKEGRLNGQDPVLITSAPYRENGPDPLLAARKSRYYRELALRVISREFPDLLARLKVLCTTVDLRTMKLDVLDATTEPAR